MAITITPTKFTPEQRLAGDLLHVVGDIEDMLVIPADEKREINGESWVHAYYISLSDGSLIRARNDPAMPDFEVVIPGPAGAMVDPYGRILSVPGKVNWITLSSNCCAVAVAQEPPENLPLFA